MGPKYLLESLAVALNHFLLFQPSHSMILRSSTNQLLISKVIVAFQASHHPDIVASLTIRWICEVSQLRSVSDGIVRITRTSSSLLARSAGIGISSLRVACFRCPIVFFWLRAYIAFQGIARCTLAVITRNLCEGFSCQIPTTEVVRSPGENDLEGFTHWFPPAEEGLEDPAMME